LIPPLTLIRTLGIARARRAGSLSGVMPTERTLAAMLMCLAVGAGGMWMASNFRL
jgi:hypothetical protein